MGREMPLIPGSKLDFFKVWVMDFSMKAVVSKGDESQRREIVIHILLRKPLGPPAQR